MPMLVAEPTSGAVRREYEADPQVVAWWATAVECVSALTRLERDGALDRGSMADALARLEVIRAAWHEILPLEPVRQTGIRLLRTHPLRTGDALQLAAAIVASEDQPGSLPFVTLDVRLADAAEREGFAVFMPG
jgi:predicted nucleic acid-binding protein